MKEDNMRTSLDMNRSFHYMLKNHINMLSENSGHHVKMKDWIMEAVKEKLQREGAKGLKRPARLREY